jgi:hypothetical protein
MALVNSVRVSVRKSPVGQFAGLVDGRRVATCDTEEEATRVAAAEGTTIEGF